MNPTDEDFYKAMGVTPDAEFEASIHELARKMADERHPDLYDADKATTDPIVQLAREYAGL